LFLKPDPPSLRDYSIEDGVVVSLIALDELNEVGKKEKRKVGGWEGDREGPCWDDVYNASRSALSEIARMHRAEKNRFEYAPSLQKVCESIIDGVMEHLPSKIFLKNEMSLLSPVILSVLALSAVVQNCCGRECNEAKKPVLPGSYIMHSNIFSHAAHSNITNHNSFTPPVPPSQRIKLKQWSIAASKCFSSSRANPTRNLETRNLVLWFTTRLTPTTSDGCRQLNGYLMKRCRIARTKARI
jgi:hypothetical protein